MIELSINARFKKGEVRIILGFDSQCISKGKGKASPVQAWTCSEGSRRLKLQDF